MANFLRQPNSNSLQLTTRPRFLPSSHWSYLLHLLLLISGIFGSSAAFHSQSIALTKLGRASVSCLFGKRSAPKKSRKRRKQVSTSTSTSTTSSCPLTEDELVRHVTSQYVTGVGGVFYKAMTRTHKHDREDDFAKFMKTLDRYPALVLNADYQPISYLPLSMWHWQEAVKAIFAGKVTVVETYPDVVIHTASLEIPLPSVIALNEYVQPFHAIPAFTKRNVFLRDEYKCQYCNDRFHTKDLSLDHVVPRCRGGRLEWENAVTCCRRCNTKKGALSLQQLRSVGMKLVRKPIVPTQFQLHAIAGRMLPRKVHPTWAPFLGLNDDENSNNNKETATSRTSTAGVKEGLVQGYYEEFVFRGQG